MKKIIMIHVFMFLATMLIAQNMIPNSDAFYDIKDTTICIRSYHETMPLLDIVDNEIKETLEEFVKKSIPTFIDTTGYTFSLSLHYQEQDSTHLHIYIVAHSNLSLGRYYAMREYRASYVCEKCKERTIGGIWVNGYYVMVDAPNYVADSELWALFKKKKERQKVCIHLIPEEKELVWYDSRVIHLPQTHFYIIMHNSCNYVSPRCDY